MVTYRVERDIIDVTTMGATKPDPDWRYADREGHEHRYVDSDLPTLVFVQKDAYWCSDCRDEHFADEHWECRICGEEVEPHRLDDNGPHMIIGRIHYFRDDVEITQSEFESEMPQP